MKRASQLCSTCSTLCLSNKAQLIQGQGTQPEVSSLQSQVLNFLYSSLLTSPIGCGDQSTAMSSTNSTSCADLSEWKWLEHISRWEMELRWFAILWNRSFLAFATRFFHDLQALRQRFQRLHLCYLYVPSMLPSQSYACRAFKSAATSRAETGTRPWYRRDLASLDLKKRAGSVCTRNTATDPNLIVIWHICNCQKLFSIGENYNIRLSRYFHLPSLMSLLDFWDFWMIWEFEGLRRDFVGLRRLHFSAPSKPSLHLLDLHFVIVSSQNIGHGTVYARICKDMQGYARYAKHVSLCNLRWREVDFVRWNCSLHVAYRAYLCLPGIVDSGRLNC